MMSGIVYYFFVLLCYSITESDAVNPENAALVTVFLILRHYLYVLNLLVLISDSIRYYYDYECNQPLVANAKLTATSSLRDRGPENAKLYGELEMCDSA
ncbi:hypothetical protein HF086_011511 [Spodoptera exigua]|uniref:Uncharacterized protein n=1 Tax=Spodoptera exigua TaxID=7107 RepID=A0A922M3T4_SPOEX|nr:hypothetical protein HF086_011511 [Spodoptera exigua]